MMNEYHHPLTSNTKTIYYLDDDSSYKVCVSTKLKIQNRILSSFLTVTISWPSLKRLRKFEPSFSLSLSHTKKVENTLS